jgi:hypothetical protein
MGNSKILHGYCKFQGDVIKKRVKRKCHRHPTTALMPTCVTPIERKRRNASNDMEE